MNVERLEDLYKALTTEIPDDPHNFDMHFWYDHEPEAKCGTVACAWGWYTILRAPTNPDLFLRNDVPAFRPDPLGPWAGRTFRGVLSGFHAAAAYFDIPMKSAQRLFSASAYDQPGPVTKHDVALRVRELIESYTPATEEQANG